jgi:hypothetical protein
VVKCNRPLAGIAQNPAGPVAAEAINKTAIQEIAIMKSPTIFSRALVLAALCLPLAAFAGLKEDMVAFDRAYIPALAVTAEGKLPESQRAMEQLNKQWAAFKKQHATTRGGDKKWKTDLADIDRMIAEANKVVAGGVDIQQAHNALEGVRLTMLDMRARSKMPYYVDMLTHFHDPMEEIVLLAKDKTPATFGAEEIAKLRAALPEAEKRWAAVKATRLDPAFGFNAEQQANLAKLVASESAALETLKQALAGDDRAAIIKAALAVKPPFAKIFMAFGNFEPVRR